MWRSRMFWRSFGAYSFLLAASLGTLAWVLLYRMENRLVDQIRQTLEVKTSLVREIAADTGQAPAERQKQVIRLGRETDSRITLIAGDGVVLADSNEDPAGMENHAERPEIQQAKTHGTGSATRYSETLRQSMLYVARRVDEGSVRYVRVALPLTAVEKEIGRLHRMVWTGVGLTLLLALLLSWFLSRRISGPLVELADAARAITAGHPDQQVDIRTRDEVGVLVTAFNEMAQANASQLAQLDQDRQQLRTILRSMVEGVLVLDADQQVEFLNDAAGRLLNVPPETAHRKKLWQIVRQRQFTLAVEAILASDSPYQCEVEWGGGERRVLAIHGSRLPGPPIRGAVLVLHDVTDLRKLERIRQDFVANVSHELKTPLAAIQATVETLLDGALHDAEHNHRFLERIRENSDRLHRLVQDLLTLGRIESGEQAMELEPVDLESAVSACIAHLEDRAGLQQLQLIQQPPAEPVDVLADEEALADILDNLVDNAIKYTPAGGSVTIRWRPQDTKVAIQIEDTGIGISDKDLPRIFERFYRVDRARSRELGGTGLGLSIVKHLTLALGGSITAQSQLGVGSTFTILLPRAQLPSREADRKTMQSASNLH